MTVPAVSNVISVSLSHLRAFPGTRADILQGNLGGFKGAIFENLMADTLHKKQQSLYYFLKDSGLELDFLVRMKGECVPLEVKAKTAQSKSVQTVLKYADKYHVKHIIKFGDMLFLYFLG